MDYHKKDISVEAVKDYQCKPGHLICIENKTGNAIKQTVSKDANVYDAIMFILYGIIMFI